MSYFGLKIRDPAGNVTLDSNDFTTIYLGTGETGTSNGSITDDNIQGRNVWVTASILSHPPYEKMASLPHFIVKGNTISWEFASEFTTAVKCSMRFVYGVY